VKNQKIFNKDVVNISNTLSFLRAPLALLFLKQSVLFRLFAIIMAMFTDSIDGYIARKNNTVSKFGAILDPVMDKFFVTFILVVFFIEQNIELWQILALLSRDFFLFLYGLLVAVRKNWKTMKIKPVSWGKITTALQFFVLIGLTLNFSFPWYIYCSFVGFGMLAFLELVQKRGEKVSSI